MLITISKTLLLHICVDKETHIPIAEICFSTFDNCIHHSFLFSFVILYLLIFIHLKHHSEKGVLPHHTAPGACATKTVFPF